MTAPDAPLARQLLRRKPVARLIAESSGDEGATTGTSVWNTVVVSLGVALLAGFVPLDVLADRRTHPDMPRGFRAPGCPVTPLLSIAACGYVISGLHPLTFGFFVAWLTGAALVYFGYSVKHSRLRDAEQPEADPRRARP